MNEKLSFVVFMEKTNLIFNFWGRSDIAESGLYK
jgi:hypothetical protein